MEIQILVSFSYQAFIFTHFPIILREKNLFHRHFKRNWELKHQDNYEIHSFKEAKSKFKVTCWPSSKTFTIQGSESSKVINMVENILNLPEESENELAAEASTKSTPKSKKRSSNKSKSRLNVNSQVSHKSEFRKIWEVIESLKANVANRTDGSGNISNLKKSQALWLLTDTTY